jgi:hypothetical protein
MRKESGQGRKKRSEDCAGEGRENGREGVDRSE